MFSPPEILSKIFRTYANSIRWRHHSLGWVRVTQVCSRWREIALNCASLWSDITVMHRESTNLLLSRAGDAPLSVIALKSRLVDPEVLQKVFAGVGHRLYSIELKSSISNGLNIRNALSQLPRQMDGLKALELRGALAQCLSSDSIPAGFLEGQGCAPALKHLIVMDCSMLYWSHLPLAHGLTSLILRDHNIPRCLPLSKTILGSLRHMPHLQTLFLAGVLPRGADASSAPIILRELELLDLSDSFDAIQGFLRLAQIPPAASIGMYFHKPDEQLFPTKLDHFLMALAIPTDTFPCAETSPQHHTHFVFGEVTELHISGSYGSDYPRPEFEFWRPTSLGERFIRAHLTMALSPRVGWSPQESTSIGQALDQRLNLQTLQLLTLKLCKYLESEAGTAFGRSPVHETIKFRHSSVEGGADDGFGKEYWAMMAHFPKLRAVRCTGAEFQDMMKVDLADVERLELVNSLADALDARSKYCATLDLDIQDRHFTSQVTEVLGKVARFVGGAGGIL